LIIPNHAVILIIMSSEKFEHSPTNLQAYSHLGEAAKRFSSYWTREENAGNVAKDLAEVEKVRKKRREQYKEIAEE
jgi:hypothetical protein